MSYLEWAGTYFSTLLAFLVIDFLWLGVLARDFYHRCLAGFLSEEINWAAAFLFYAIFILGMMVFVIHPALAHNSLLRATLLGMLYGLVTYATYDLTNLALLKEWPLNIVIVDIAWGTALNGIVASIGFWIATRFT